MKHKFLLIALLAAVTISFTSCNEIQNKELFEKTDYYVESLNTVYESYGMFGGDAEYTKDGEYKIQPFGRLINVRIEHEASDKDYEDLVDDLKSHYKGDSRVNDVYRCQAGTVMIDCRN